MGLGFQLVSLVALGLGLGLGVIGGAISCGTGRTLGHFNSKLAFFPSQSPIRLGAENVNERHLIQAFLDSFP